jgi:RNA polymerase sigma-70 factor (ECF subfamily)
LDGQALDGAALEDLVIRAQRGDQAAFNRLIADQYRFIFRVAFRVLGHKSDAEDVTQTVCMRLATTLGSFDRRASFTSWLYRITINAARDLLRAQMRRQKLADSAAAFVADHVEADQEAQRHVADIWNTVRQLPEKQREAVILVHGEGLSQEEAARIMSCQKVTVAWHLHNARKALRELL